MRTPKAEKEDPAVVAAREREQARAEASRTEETQALLMGATQRRLRRFGRLGNSGSVSLINPAVGSVGGVMGRGVMGGGAAGGSASSSPGDRGGGVRDVSLAVY